MDASTRRYLDIYLNDHLAGATAGANLARRAERNARTPEMRETLTNIADEIHADLDSLRTIMRRFGIRPSGFKVAAGWTLERLGRLKLNGHPFGPSPLSSLIELEALSLGVEGKLAVWRTLNCLSEVDELSEQLNELIDRGETQRAELERLRLHASQRALGRICRRRS